MAEESRYSIIEAITKAQGFDIALMTTFNFDIDYFERVIVSQLYEKNVRKISVFVDADELTKAFYEVESCSIGSKYMVNPVRINSAFHPKVFLLLGKDKARLVVGSANIKTSGFAINNEIFNFYEYSKKDTQYLDVINTAIKFFLDINENSYKLDNELLDEVRRLPYYRSAPYNGEVKLLSNLKTSLLSQIKNEISEEVRTIKIAVPYYDNTISALKEISESFPGSTIKLYIQNRKSSFPVDYYNKQNLDCNIISFDGFRDGDSYSKNNFYHGKVFLFETDKDAYILYGSANCTSAAMTKALDEGGNVECALLEKGEKDDFNSFFDNFEENTTDELKTNILDYSGNTYNHYYFKYGELLEDGCLKLHIGCSHAQALIVRVDGMEMKHLVSDNEIIVDVPVLFVDPYKGIFDIEIESDAECEHLMGWFYNKFILQSNRQKHADKYTLDRFDSSIKSDKFIPDRYNLLTAWASTTAELLEQNKMLASIKQMEQEAEDNDSASDDFIVDVQIPEDYATEYRTFEMISHIRDGYIRRLISGDLGLFRLSDHKERKYQKSELAGSEPVHRAPLTEEKSFARFVNGRVKGLLDDQFVSKVTPKNYYGIVLVVLEIFFKYLGIGLFDLKYVIDTRTKFFVNMLGMDFSDESELESQLKRNAIGILIDNYLISQGVKDITEKEEYDSINKTLLLAIEKRFPMRSNYIDVISSLIVEDNNYIPHYDDYFANYMESLYGYKSKELLVKFIQTKYDNAEVIFNGKDIFICASSDSINKHFDPNMLVVKEVGDYSRKVETIDTLTILVRSYTGKIKEVEHVISYRFKTWKSKTIYNNGNVLENKPEYINV